QPPARVRARRTLPALRASRRIRADPRRVHGHDRAVDDVGGRVARPDAASERVGLHLASTLVRYESSVTSVSWIPSAGAARGAAAKRTVPSEPAPLNHTSGG